jgi:hypothetical protein
MGLRVKFFDNIELMGTVTPINTTLFIRREVFDGDARSIVEVRKGETGVYIDPESAKKVANFFLDMICCCLI